MQEKSTQELQQVLLGSHPKNLAEIMGHEQDFFYSGKNEFDQYMKQKLKEKKLSKRDVLIAADIPERYGYKLFSGQKKTRQRDVIYRICYAAGLNFTETEKALRLYQLPELYAKQRRDAILIIALNEEKRDIFEVNRMLVEYGEDMLYSFDDSSILAGEET